MRLPRIVLMTLLTVIGLLALTTPAWAHTHLESSTPAEGATLSAPPAAVKLTFGKPVSLPPSPISVTGPGGAAWSLGPATVAGQVVSAPVTASGPAGAYVVKYRVTAADGDLITGAVKFILAAR